MKKPWMIILFFSFASCSMLKRDAHLSKIQRLDQHRIALTENTKLQKLTLSTDSNGSETYVTLNPVGVFSYSITDGFKGEAAQLTIKRKEGQKKQVLAKSTGEHQLAITKVVQQAENKILEEKSKQNVRFNWLPLLGIVCGLGLFYFLWVTIRRRLFVN